MALLKYRDEDGVVREVVALKGDKGDPGGGAAVDITFDNSNDTFVPLSDNVQDALEDLSRAIGEEHHCSINTSHGFSNTLSNALKGTASGEIVTLPDVSPVEHDIAVNVKRKNFFNKENMQYGNETWQSTSCLLEDGRIYVPKNAMNCGRTLKQLAPEIEVGKTYILTFATTGELKHIYLRTTEAVWNMGTARTIVETDLESNVYFYTFSGDKKDEPAYVTDFQIEEGTVATGYTPYIEDLASVKVVAAGKNLVNNDEFKNVDRWIQSDTIGGSRNNGNYVLNLTSNTTYTISWNYENEAPQYFYFCSYPKGKQLEYGNQNTEKYLCGVGEPALTHTFTAEPTKDYVLFLSAYKTCLPNITFLQIEPGTTATEYEPHTGAEYYAGEVVKSIYPTTVITTDTEGALIDVQYNKDINKVVETLVQAIILLGGTV